MKIRKGFISNSSSSSFLIKTSMSEEDLISFLDNTSFSTYKKVVENVYLLHGYDWNLDELDKNTNIEIFEIYEN